jgi:hypothetical protein
MEMQVDWPVRPNPDHTSAYTQEKEMMQAGMRQAYLLKVVVVAMFVVIGGTVFAQSSNPLIGTWKLNVAKSKYNSGTVNKSGTTKFEAAGAGVKVTVDAVAADGTVMHWTFTTNYDGKDGPITGNSQYGDVVAVTRVNANTTRNIYKNGGKVTTTQTIVVAGDGKTRTVTSKGTDAHGQTVDSVVFYDKQ